MKNSLRWIDIGVNLTNTGFDKDRDQVIADAQDAGVVYQIVTGTNAKDSHQAHRLCKKHPQQLFSTAGCHPHDAKDFSKQDLTKIKKLLTQPQVVAVGECGLDFNRNFSPKEQQLSVFERQLQLAVEVNKPLFLHERDAFDAQHALLRNYRSQIKGAVIHCFTGEAHALKAYLDLDLYIGITGWICDERRGQTLNDLVRYIPDDRLMIETDAPYLLPRNMRPKPRSSRNLPQYLPYVAQKIAEARNCSLQELSTQCFRNSVNFFQLEAS
ncbi:MAG: TatD family hydrolase [Enterobacterales bacterium]|nr:TatD family hydrolase [Enterobacterales bacterium]